MTKASFDLFKDREGDRRVLMLIGGGIVTIIMTIIGALAFARGMPDWAESVFSAIVGGALVKLADVLSALVSLSSSRQLERVTDQLSTSGPQGEKQVVEIDQPANNPIPVDTGET